MKKINIGVLGVSNHFIKRIVLPLQKTENCHIYSISSRTPQKSKEASELFNIPMYHNSYDDLINDPNVDAIYNPLPNHLHAEWTIKALKANKPVLCEKPLALNTTEATELHKLSIKTGVPLMEAFMYRFHPMWIHVKDIIKTNQIGSVNQIHTAFSYNNPSPSNIRNIKAFGGGALMDIGCYAVSVARFLLNKEPIRVISLISQHPDFETDMHTSGIMDFDDARASFHVSTLSEPFQKVDIIGSAGSLTVHLPFNTFVDVPSEITVNSSLGSRTIKFPESDAYGLMFDAFANAVIHKLPMPTELTDAINNMKVIDAIIKSAKSNKWIEL